MQATPALYEKKIDNVDDVVVLALLIGPFLACREQSRLICD
jgi:hypothetical protein